MPYLSCLYPSFSQMLPFSEFCSHFSVTFPLTLHGVFSSPALKPQFGALSSFSAHLSPPSHLGPAASPEATMSFNIHCLDFIPYFAVTLLSHVSLSEGRVSPSPESPLLLPLVSCLFHHRAVWSCPLFLSKQFLLSWGMSPLLLPSSLPLPGKPAVLPSLTLALAGAPWPQCRDLPPLPPFSTSSGALCVPLSQQLTDPHCKRDSAQAGPGTMLSGLRGGTHRLPEDFSLGEMALSVWESLECPVSAWL